MAAFVAVRDRWDRGWPGLAATGIAVLLFVFAVLFGAGGAGAAPSATHDAPATGVLDDFDRGNENPVWQWGNWGSTGIAGGMPAPVVGNALTRGNSGSAYREAVSPGDMEAYYTVVSAPTNLNAQFLYVALDAVGTATYDGYALVLAANGHGGLNLHLRRYDDGTATELVVPAPSVTVASGDKLMLRRYGASIEGWVHQAGAWQLRVSASDGSYTGGRIGVRFHDSGFGNGGGSIDDFGGTGTTTPPPPPPPVPATPVLDDFDRPNENPVSQGGEWAQAAIAGGVPLATSANRLVPSNAYSAYRVDDVDNDMEAYHTIVSAPTNLNAQFLYIALKEAGTGAYDGYALALAANGSGALSLILRRYDNGVQTTLGATPTIPVSPGDKMLLRRVGATIEGWLQHGGTWTRHLSAPNQAAHGGAGKIGVRFHDSGFGNGGGLIDDFGGGEIGAPPPPPPPPPPGGGPPLRQSQGTCSGSGLHAIAASRCLSDPVNTLTGAFVTAAEDLSFPSTGVSFAWNRTYTSTDSASGRLGPGWTDSYSTSLEVEPSGDVFLHGDEGQIVGYTKQSDGSFAGAAGARSTLVAAAGGYELVRTDQVVYRFDAQGRLLSIKDRNDQGLTLHYGPTGRLETIAGPSRRAIVSYAADGLVSGVSHGSRNIAYGYTDGRLTSFTDVRGKTWRFTYDAGGRLATIVDPLDHVQVANVYDADGRVQSQTDALGKTTTFAWAEATQTATVTDANGNTWKDDYDENVLVERSDPLGNDTTFAHDDDLNAAGVTSPAGETTSMTYDARGNLLSATAPASLGAVRKTFAYNANNHPVRVTDARDVVTSYTYDPAGNTETVIQDGTQVASYTYDAAGRVLTSTDGNGRTTVFAYDSLGNLASETDPLGNRTSYTYDDAGRVLTRVDPRGNAPGANPADFTWRWTYNAASQVLTERDPLGGVTTHTYDDAGNELSATDANGRTTTFAYDNANRLVSETGPDPDGGGPLPAPATSYTYDDAGNRRTQTDVLGRTTTFAYDAANRLVSTTGPDPDGAGPLSAPVTTSAYDANGNLASTVGPRGNVAGADAAEYRTTFTYDAAGRLLTTTNPLGNVTTNAFDAVGNLVSARDANGHTTISSYDGSGRVVTVTAPAGGATAYTHDGAGNPLTRTDANGHVTTYAFDAAGRLARESLPDPDGPGPKGPAVTTHEYDANGNLASTVDANGNATTLAGDGRTTFAYDSANRLVRMDYSDSTPDVSFTYDAAGNRVAMTDGSGTETRSYDGLNRLTSVTRGSNTFSYGYDAVGNVARRTYPGGMTTVYVHDGLDRLASAASGGRMSSYAYDAASNLTQTTLPSGNGHVESRVYDRAGRLTEVTNRRGSTTLASFAATLDGVGNPTQIVRTGALQQTQTFTYDPNDRIASVCFQPGTCPGAQDPFVRWTYDQVGNRLTERRGGAGTTDYAYDAADRMTRAGSTSFTYDENGNQLSAGSRTFTYDLANRLRTTRRSSTTTTYSYNGDGVRLQASTGSSSSSKTNFLWDVSHSLPQIAVERNGSGSTLRQYAYGARRISMTSGSNTSYYHYDGLGSVVNVTSSSGSRRWTWSYEPFGAIRTEQRSGDSAPTNFMKFTGEYLDPTELYHLRARQYDAATGRFLRRDPVDGSVGSPVIAAYVYAANRPMVMVDPSGETFQPAGDGSESGQFAASLVDWETPALRCMSPSCGNRPVSRYVYPIPKRFPGRIVTFPSDPTYGFHNTSGLPGYPAIDFAAARGTPVVAVEKGRIREFSSAQGGAALYLRADSGIDYFYGHIRIGSVTRGQRVQAGQRIARLAALSTLDHLHLGANANVGGSIVGRGRAGTDDRRDRATQRARDVMRAVARAPRV